MSTNQAQPPQVASHGRISKNLFQIRMSGLSYRPSEWGVGPRHLFFEHSQVRGATFYPFSSASMPWSHSQWRLNLEFLTFQLQEPRLWKCNEIYGFLCQLWDSGTMWPWMNRLPSLGLNVLTSTLGTEGKLQSNSGSLEFSMPHFGYTSQRPLCGNSTSLSPGSRQGPSIMQ